MEFEEADRQKAKLEATRIQRLKKKEKRKRSDFELNSTARAKLRVRTFFNFISFRHKSSKTENIAILN